MLKDNILSFDVPKPVRTDVGISVNLSDSSSHYIPANEYYTIPIHSATPYQTDELLLLTKDGKGCVGEANPNQCFAGKTLKYADVDILVKDVEDNDPIE